jgi:RNA polymerase primary sigma factor
MRDLRITKSHTDRTEDSLFRYLGDIAPIRLIDANEEALLARKIRGGDKSAEHRLVTANLRFVIYCAKKYKNLGLGMGDLISEGNLGLIKAARLFDETRGFKFISYAVWWVRQAMMTAINEHVRMIRVPMNQQLGMSQINAEAERLEQLLEREPTLSELSEMIGKDQGKLADIIQSNTRTRYLDDQIPGGETETNTLLNFVPDPNSNLVEEAAWAEARSTIVNGLLSRLSDREREILKLVFGLCGCAPLEIEDIAINLGLSKERVRQLRWSAMLKLKDIPEVIRFKEYA